MHISLSSMRPFHGMIRRPLYILFALAGMAWTPCATAAELDIRVENPPPQGSVKAMLFNSSSTFVDLRDPVRVVALTPGQGLSGRIAALPSG